jgi:glycosyltransferase involved in cell wall biosynthesis
MNDDMGWAAAEGISRTGVERSDCVSVLLATAGRPEMARAFTETLVATTEGHNIELIVAVDGDPATVEQIKTVEPHDGFRAVFDWQPEHRGCSIAWNDALAKSHGDPVMLAADDLEFQDGWLDAALAKMSEFPDGWGFVGFNDGHWGAELSTHYLMSRRFVIEVLGGRVAWPCYHHSFNDVEANARAVAAGRYAWCETARVLHRHWIFGDRQQDQTDTRMLGAHPDSERAFAQRKAAGFPDDFEAVIEC